MAGRGRASGRYPPDLPDRTSGGHRGRDAGCGMREQTANCKQDRSMSCVVPPSKRASIGQPNHSKRASRPESLSFAFSSLPVFTSSRFRDFEISRFRNFAPLEPFSNHSSDSTRPPIRPFAHSLIRPFAHIAHVAPLAPIAKPCPRPADPRRPPGVAASRNALGCERPEAVAPRRATPHARLSRARGRRRDCARPPSPDRAPDRPPRRSRRYAARTRRPDATPRRRR
ncbi:Uncharacterised protein [Burkholderia pseudomallei]|nr:Uncharacterised protein [Burkholderia pseudomallei]CAJ9119502.1 Uncharacterised protein [Burkholderia pseudomallei]VBQ99606.1 Uncharacterised protein [Burkholderia pseudomallei]